VSTKQQSSTMQHNPVNTPSLSKGYEPTKERYIDNTSPTDDNIDAVITELHAEHPTETLTTPVLSRRQAYQITRRRVVDTSLDEGEKLHAMGCIRRGVSPSHFIFTGKNEAKTRHDIHVVFEEAAVPNFWDALLCSCPIGRHHGDPCWHKGAVRAFLADNQHIRHANKLLALPLS